MASTSSTRCLAMIAPLLAVLSLLLPLLGVSAGADAVLTFSMGLILAPLAAVSGLLARIQFRGQHPSAYERVSANTGFLLGVMVFSFALFVTFWLPTLSRGPGPGNPAVGNLRSIAGAETAFLSSQIKLVDGVAQYATLRELGEPEPPFLEGSLTRGAANGYVFVLTVTKGDPSSFTCHAIPQVPGETGIRCFFLDETGVIRYTDDGSMPSAASRPIGE